MKKIFMLLSAIFICAICTISTFALDNAPSEVSSVAKTSINDFKPILSEQREKFGISSQDNIDKTLSLGEGFASYEISTDNLVNKNGNLFKNSGRYIFPIKVENKSCGMAVVEKFQGKWQVVQIFSENSFEEDINTTKSQLGSDENSQLIYDQRFGVLALGNKENIIPLKDNENFKLYKGKRSTINDVTPSLKKYHEQNKDSKTFGGGSVDMNTSYYIYLAIATFSWMLFAGTVLYKKKCTVNIESNV